MSSNTTFMTSPSFFFTSESVTEGHPDKMCDQISDSVLDAIVKDDPNARVACETAITTGLILVMGEITTSTYVDIAEKITGSKLAFTDNPRQEVIDVLKSEYRLVD